MFSHDVEIKSPNGLSVTDRFMNLLEFRSYLEYTGQLDACADAVHSLAAWQGSHLSWYIKESEMSRPKEVRSCMSFSQFISFHRAHVGKPFPSLRTQLDTLGIPAMTTEEERRLVVEHTFDKFAVFMGEGRSKRIADLKRSRINEEKRERRRRERLAAKEGRKLRPARPRVDKPDEKDIPHDEIDADTLQMLIWELHKLDVSIPKCEVILDNLSYDSSGTQHVSPDEKNRPLKRNVLSFLVKNDLGLSSITSSEDEPDFTGVAQLKRGGNKFGGGRSANNKGGVGISSIFSRLRMRLKNFAAKARLLNRNVKAAYKLHGARFGWSHSRESEVLSTHIDFSVGDLKMRRMRTGPGNRVDVEIDWARMKPLEASEILDEVGAPEESSSFLSINLKLKPGIEPSLLERDIQNVGRVLVKKYMLDVLKELPGYFDYDVAVVDEEDGGHALQATIFFTGDGANIMDAWESVVDVGTVIQHLHVEAKVTPSLKWVLSHPERRKESILNELIKIRSTAVLRLNKGGLIRYLSAYASSLESSVISTRRQNATKIKSGIKSFIKFVETTNASEFKVGLPTLMSIFDGRRAEGRFAESLIGLRFVSKIRRFLEDPGALAETLSSGYMYVFGMEGEKLSDRIAEIYERFEAGVSNSEEDGVVRAHKLLAEYVVGIGEIRLVVGTVSIKCTIANLETGQLVVKKTKNWERAEQ